MKYKNVVLLFIIASLFLVFVPYKAVATASGTTVTLSVPNLPRGG